VPDLAAGTYHVSMLFLDMEVGRKTVEVREGLAPTWLHTTPLEFPPPSQPSWTLWRRTPASRPDFTNRDVAREVYALVIGALTDRIGSRALIERETAHSGGAVFQDPAHRIMPLADSIRRALKEQAHRQIVWHHHAIFPPTVTVINKADVPKDAESHTRWRARLGLEETQNLHVFSVSRVFVSEEGTQAIVFAHDSCAAGCGRGDLFWLGRPHRAAPWSIQRVDLLWIA
jgi:hypothetical protein